MAALSISAALVGRERSGEGCFLDLSILEASISAMGWAVSNYVISGIPPVPMGRENATAAPSGTFFAADGPLNTAANRQGQFVTLCDLLGRPELAEHQRFANRDDRKDNRGELNDELTAALKARPELAWERVLSAAGVPAARILTVPQALQSEQLARRGFFTELPFADAPGRTLWVSGYGVHVNGEPPRPEGGPPLLGEHNEDLAELARRWGGTGIPRPAEEFSLTPTEKD